MSLLPDSATFHERVEDCFVTYRGRGVSLSAADLELVDDWAEAAVPFEVIARGIRKAAERVAFDASADDGSLRLLRACRREVEREIDKYRSRAVGSGGEAQPGRPFHEERHEKLKAAVRKLARRKTTLVKVSERVERLPSPPDFAAADRHEALVVGWLVRALPFAERVALLGEVTLGLPPTLSAPARREGRRFQLQAKIRQRFSVPAFW